MTYKFSRLIFALTVALTGFSFASLAATTQAQTRQSWFDGGSYNSQNEIDAMYSSNARGPLGGLFAPNFTRTLTVLGGFNFLSEATSNDLAFEPSITGTSLLLPAPPTSEVDKDGYAISFAFGRRHSQRLRSEIEVAFRSNDIDQRFGGLTTPATHTQDGSIDVSSLMKNFIIDFENSSRFTPYAGAGLGLSYVDVKFGEASSADGEATFQDGQGLFSYQAIGGVATRLNSFADFIVEYRFLGTSEVEFEGLGRSLSYNTSSLFLGVKFEY